MTSIYSVSDSENGIILQPLSVDPGLLPDGYTSFATIEWEHATILYAYNKAAKTFDTFEVSENDPFLNPLSAGSTEMDVYAWDSMKPFVLGNKPYLMAYEMENGFFGFYEVKADYSLSKPYTFMNQRSWPTQHFSEVMPFVCVGLLYVLGYDVVKGTVAIFSVSVVATSADGVPPLNMLNVWYHQWAKGWQDFAFFTLGQSNFFFKINKAKLNVNIDHVLDTPALGTVEIGSWLQALLPNAMQVTMSAIIPWPNGEPYLVTYDNTSISLNVYRIHPDCQGWTNRNTTSVAVAGQLISYCIGNNILHFSILNRKNFHAMESMKTPVEARDMNWIKQSLQSAIELEFSTLPLYLSSMFSLEVQNYTAYNTIRSVAMEEMVHMAIAGNILAALGGSPAIKNMKINYPVQGLPGGCEPDMFIGLAQFSKPQLKKFMRIEIPAFLLPEQDLPEEYPTIAKFYDGIKQAIVANGDAVREAVKNQKSPPNQVGDNIGFATFNYTEGVDPVKMLCSGIDEILDQGEGNKDDDLITGSEFETEESHYAKFASLYYGGAFQLPEPPVKITIENEPTFFRGLPIGWPEVINTLAVPADGYAKILAIDPNSSVIIPELDAFDQAFSTMLATLDTVWNGDTAQSWKNLGAAVGSMVSFRVLSCFNIMRYSIPEDIIQKLPELYPDEIDFLSTYTRLSEPVFYGPRFLNKNI